MAAQLSWLIFGAGAVGTYIGGSLLLQGEKVVFLEQPESASLIWEHGLKLNINGQDYRVLHPQTFSSMAAALSYSSYDVIIFALKSFDTQSAIEAMRPFIADIPPVLCLQNGVENEIALIELLGQSRVIAGTVTSSISRYASGEIVLERLRGMGIAKDHQLSSRLAEILSTAKLNAHLYRSPQAMKWSKMLTNLMANASSAILDMTPTEVLSHPFLYRMEIEQIREALAVMRKLGISVINLPGVPVRWFAWAVNHLPPTISQPFVSRLAGGGRGGKMPSFHIDLYSGRGKSEVEYLNGAVVRYGLLAHLPTPINQWLNQTLLDLIQGRLSTDEYSHQPEKLIDLLYLDQEID
jgi:2-dehydropantoate 2-reductase